MGLRTGDCAGMPERAGVVYDAFQPEAGPCRPHATRNGPEHRGQVGRRMLAWAAAQTSWRSVSWACQTRSRAALATSSSRRAPRSHTRPRKMAMHTYNPLLYHPDQDLPALAALSALLLLCWLDARGAHARRAQPRDEALHGAEDEARKAWRGADAHSDTEGHEGLESARLGIESRG